jgi:hypothetical protein
MDLLLARTGIVERVQDGGGSSRFAACVEQGYVMARTGIVERVQDGGGSSRFAACVEKGDC